MIKTVSKIGRGLRFVGSKTLRSAFVVAVCTGGAWGLAVGPLTGEAFCAYKDYELPHCQATQAELDTADQSLFDPRQYPILAKSYNL